MCLVSSDKSDIGCNDVAEEESNDENDTAEYYPSPVLNGVTLSFSDVISRKELSQQLREEELEDEDDATNGGADILY